jgi:hypothetical protein
LVAECCERRDCFGAAVFVEWMWAELCFFVEDSEPVERQSCFVVGAAEEFERCFPSFAWSADVGE